MPTLRKLLKYSSIRRYVGSVGKNKTFYLEMGVYEESIIPIKISHLAEYISKVKRISLDDALVYIYVNPMCERLYDENAKWWYLSTEALYDEFELRRNRQRRDVPKEVIEFYAYCLKNYATCKGISGKRAWL